MIIEDMAYQFLLAGKEIEENHMIPAIVNLSFSCELYLKALLMYKGMGNVKVHDLSKLFGLLSEKEQNEIKSAASIFEFDTFLKEADKAFIHWRYVWDYSPRIKYDEAKSKDKSNDNEYKPMLISIFDLIRFAEALSKECSEKRRSLSKMKV